MLCCMQSRVVLYLFRAYGHDLDTPVFFVLHLLGFLGLVQRCFGAWRFGSVLGCAGWVCVRLVCHMAVLFVSSVFVSACGIHVLPLMARFHR